MTDSSLLQQLRDIHYPAPISWWPLAPGWYALFLLLILIGFGTGIWAYRRWLSRKRQQYILQQLEKLKHMLQQYPESPQAVRHLSTFLKQVALLLYKRQEVGNLSGEAWLLFLNQTGHTTLFSEGVGRLLLTAPYQPKPPTQTLELLALVETWIKKQIKKL